MLLRAAGVIAILAAAVATGYFSLSLIADHPDRELLAVLVSAAATVFAGWLAWEFIITQGERAADDQIERAAARKLDAVVAISSSIHSASAWLLRLNKDLAQQGDRDGKSLRAKRDGRQLDQVLDRVLVLALLNDLSADEPT